MSFMKIDDGTKRAIGLILVVTGALLGVGALSILAPVVLGAIANVATAGSIPVTNTFQVAINNASDVYAGVFGITLPQLVGIALALLPIAIIVLVFGAFLIGGGLGKMKKQESSGAF